MKTIEIQDVTLTIPEYVVVMHDDIPFIKITEGKYEGIEYTYQDIKVNEEDESLLEYNLYSTSRFIESEMDEFQKVANDILLSILTRAIDDAESKQE
jgi:hypothetical protein